MKKLAAILCSSFLLVASPVFAQQRPIELGIDAAASFRLTEPRTTNFRIPADRLRVGFFLSDALSLEPSVLLTHSRFAGSDVTFLAGDLGLLWHLTPTPAMPSAYVRPFAGILWASRGGGAGGAAGLGVGYKGPLADRLQWRAEANLRRQFESDAVEEATGLGFSVGISYFTR